MTTPRDLDQASVEQDALVMQIKATEAIGRAMLLESLSATVASGGRLLQEHLWAVLSQFVAQGDANATERGGIYQWVIRPVEGEPVDEEPMVLIIDIQEDPLDEENESESSWDVHDDAVWGIDS